MSPTEVMKRVLKVLENKQLRTDEHLIPIIVDDLRQAIEQAGKDVRNVDTLEPVAFPGPTFQQVAPGIEVGYDMVGGVDIRLGGDFVYVHINYDYRYTDNASRANLADRIVGLLTHPPTAQPLTDDQIKAIYNNVKGLDFYLNFAKAIEATHGIKGASL